MSFFIRATAVLLFVLGIMSPLHAQTEAFHTVGGFAIIQGERTTQCSTEFWVTTFSDLKTNKREDRQNAAFVWSKRDWCGSDIIFEVVTGSSLDPNPADNPFTDVSFNGNRTEGELNTLLSGRKITLSPVLSVESVPIEIEMYVSTMPNITPEVEQDNELAYNSECLEVRYPLNRQRRPITDGEIVKMVIDGESIDLISNADYEGSEIGFSNVGTITHHWRKSQSCPP